MNLEDIESKLECANSYLDDAEHEYRQAYSNAEHAECSLDEARREINRALGEVRSIFVKMENDRQLMLDFLHTLVNLDPKTDRPVYINGDYIPLTEWKKPIGVVEESAAKLYKMLKYNE